jgi:N-acetylneuraminate synthase/N,N'-diacetyllegionaminate synthase
MAKKIHVGNHLIGENEPCYIIAEAGVNHNGDTDLAKSLIDVAVKSGADAIKFQTFKTESVVTLCAEKAAYQKKSTGCDESQYELIRKLELSYDVFLELKHYTEEKKIDFLSTPFDIESVDFLDEIGISAFKIPSGEINNFALLKYISKKHKPIILSTGMSTLGEVEQAIKVIIGEGNTEIILLHCVTNYPADVVDVNLRAMDTMRHAFGYPVGYSDHTLGIVIPIAAVSCGACILEKHFTLDKDLPGPDHKASLEPEELDIMIRSIREVEMAMGTGIKIPSLSEIENKKTIRRSIVAAKNIPKNTIITSDYVTSKRPGTGISPELLSTIIGTRTKRKIKRDEILTWNDVIRVDHIGE